MLELYSCQFAPSSQSGWMEDRAKCFHLSNSIVRTSRQDILPNRMRVRAGGSNRIACFQGCPRFCSVKGGILHADSFRAQSACVLFCYFLKTFHFCKILYGDLCARKGLALSSIPFVFFGLTYTHSYNTLLAQSQCWSLYRVKGAWRHPCLKSSSTRWPLVLDPFLLTLSILFLSSFFVARPLFKRLAHHSCLPV